MELKDIKIGSPYLFRSGIYGDTAVHVTAIYNGIVHFSIDGGEASRQVRDFPELSDGMYYAIPQRIQKRETKPRKAAVGRVEIPAEVTNTIRDVPGVGKVAIVSMDPPKTETSKTRATKRHVEGVGMLSTIEMVPVADAATLYTADALDKLSAMDVRRYARKHYSTIGKLTKKADIITAIRQLESLTEETF